MKVSYDEGLASHVGPESCGGGRKVTIEALIGEGAGRVLSLENVISPGCRRCRVRRKAMVIDPPNCKDRSHPAWSQTPRAHRSISRGSREIPGLAPTPVGVQCREPE